MKITSIFNKRKKTEEEKKRINIVSFKVDGLESCINKGGNDFFKSTDYDILCLQDIKCMDELLKLDGYYSYYNCYKNDYSGTAVLSKYKPLDVKYGILNCDLDLEGRVITLEYDKFYLINVYVPNGGGNLDRLKYRTDFNEAFYDYVISLDCSKPVIIGGDFNISLLTDDDGEWCFDDDEAEDFGYFLSNGFSDTYELIHGDDKATENFDGSAGDYRLDYFIVSDNLMNLVKDTNIVDNVNCSDHYPITLEIEYSVD